MDAGSEAADLMVREGLQIAEATVKLLAAGSKNLAAFLYALAKDNKRVSGNTAFQSCLRSFLKNCAMRMFIPWYLKCVDTASLSMMTVLRRHWLPSCGRNEM